MTPTRITFVTILLAAGGAVAHAQVPGEPVPPDEDEAGMPAPTEEEPVPTETPAPDPTTPEATEPAAASESAS